MRRRFLPPILCVMLILPLLTGCMSGGSYETAHFRFTVSGAWSLSDAVYSKESRKNSALFFSSDGKDSIHVSESVNHLPQTAEYFIKEAVAYDLPENERSDGGEVEVREMHCKYDAWSGSYLTESFDSAKRRRYLTYVCAEGYLMQIEAGYCWLPPEEYYPQLQALLDSLECTGEPPVYEAGDAKAGKLRVSWSADWRKALPEDGDEYLMRLYPSHPATEQEAIIRVEITDLADTDTGKAVRINAAMRSDGMDTAIRRIRAEKLEDTTLFGMQFDDVIRTYSEGKDDDGNFYGNNDYTIDCYKTVGGKDYLVTISYDESVQDTAEALLQGINIS